MNPAPGMTCDHDVVILGGGLAGLSLAIQLRQRDPGIDVLVIERHAHPVREAAFKVGESTVEIGAHYFADVPRFPGALGLLYGVKPDKGSPRKTPE